MTRLNPIADAMTAIKNTGDIGKPECIVEPASTLLGSMLQVMLDSKYIRSYEVIEDGRGSQFRIFLNGRINKCGAITPRYSVKLDEMEYWETRYLPSKKFGILIISTSKGVMSHVQARKEGIGGELLGYVF